MNLHAAFSTAKDRLLREMNPDGFWEGELSSSALSTATSVSALAVSGLPADRPMIEAGISWLTRHQNADGGWGDTTDSPSNLATTLLTAAAFTLAHTEQEHAHTMENTRHYISIYAGDTPDELLAAIKRIYGADRTFAVPILTNCALAGMISWEQIPSLPFELAVFPRDWYKALRLHVVSYALPALIAIGLAIEHYSPTRSLLRRILRRAATGRVLKKLEAIQPEHGGFLEAAPLTSFVAMSLGSLYGSKHPVVGRCLGFLRQSQRPDGSWPIDTNLSVWLTTSSVCALASVGEIGSINSEKTLRWITTQQYQTAHPFTGAAPLGWGWTHLPGGVPDADDTSGAVLACVTLGELGAARSGVTWLLGLQNADGGWPTFCRGWGHLAFDRSSPDITAHAIRAISICDIDSSERSYLRAVKRGYDYLSRTQRPDGSWAPLWFGNQATPDKCNSVLGTSRVLLAYSDTPTCSTEAAKGVQYLLNVQNSDDGWGGGKGVASSVEETACAVSALLRFPGLVESRKAALRGAEYLATRVEDGTWTEPAPVGLYFSSLWYSERLYPLIWTVEALGLAIGGAK